MRFLALLLAALLIVACSESDSSDDDGKQPSSDDDNSNDDDNDDDNDAVDDDNDDASPADSSPSFNLGLVHYHYYGNLGGYDGDIFKEDQAWAAQNVDLAIIGSYDDLLRQTWEEIRANQPRGRWFAWESVHLFNTNESAGTCAAPELGPPDQNFAANEALFAEFLTAHPEHGDGESCFLHARYDGRVLARWHSHDCDVTLDQIGSEGSATTLRDARLLTLVWDEYGWLFDLGSDCARDWAAWKAIQRVGGDGLAGVGYDNLGSPVEDRFNVPQEIDPIDIIEIPDNLEQNNDGLNQWWFGALGGFLAAVRDEARQAAPATEVIFNGASYCSWDGSTERLADLTGAGIGVWCEGALQYPSWGALDAADRIAALIGFSTMLADRDSFLALETFYDGGESDPTPAEVMFYLAALHVFKHDGDVMAIKPDWNPYLPLKDVCWFDVFARDLGSSAAPAEQAAHGVFTRRYAREDGMETLVVVRADGDEPAVDFALDGAYCRVDADNQLTSVSGTLSLASGDGLLLIASGTGGVQCGKELAP